MIDIVKNIDDIDKVRIKISLFLVFLSSIIVFMLSFSIYLLYENQKYIEIEDGLKSKLFEILPVLNDDLKNILNTFLQEGMFLCVYDIETERKLCVSNIAGKKIDFSKFDKTKLNKNIQDIKIIQNFYTLNYHYEGPKEYYIQIGKDTIKINEDLKKLRNSIILSSFGVIILSGFLAFSVSGRLLRPLKEQKENLEHTLDIISHDLKTPLSVINTNLYLMKHKNFQNIDNHLNQIEKNLDYIKNIVSNIDALKSISEKDLEDIDIYLLIDTIIKKFQNQINQKNIKVIINQKKNLIIKANRIDMDVCFTNLIDNAIKYNINEGILKIEVGKKSVSIANTGKKIKDLRKVFDKFYREDKAGTTEGLGLGLSIVKKICKKYGFKIKAHISENMNIFTVCFK